MSCQTVKMVATASSFTKSRKGDKCFIRNTTLPRMRHKSKLVILVAILFALFLVFVCSQLWTRLRSPTGHPGSTLQSKSLHFLPTIYVQDSTQKPRRTNSKCRMFSCFDIYRCKYNENSLINVYVYPETDFVDSKGERLLLKPMSQQYHELITAIQQSNYYTTDKDNACIIVPSIDTLSQNGLDLNAVTKALFSLPRLVCFHNIFHFSI